MNAAGFLARLDPIGFAVTRFVAGALWQSTLLFAAVAIVVWLVRRRRASLKHALLAVALLTAPVLPLLTRAVMELGAPRAEVKLIPPYQGVAPAQPAVLVEPVIAPDSAHMSPEPPAVYASPASAAAPFITDYPWALAGIAYVAGLTALLAWIAVGHARINSWKRRASAVADQRVIEAFRRAAASLGVHRRFRTLESDAVGCPFSVGVFDPVVFLPHGFASSLADDELNAVALHETAHIKRRDPLVLSLVALARAVLFLQPIVWLAARRASFYAEQAADDAVLGANLEPLPYARALTRIAESICGPAVSVEIAAGIVISRSAFITRIEAILSRRPESVRRVSRLLALAAALALLFSVAFTLAVPLGDRGTHELRVQVASAPDGTEPVPAAEATSVAPVKLEPDGPNAMPPSVLAEPDETIPTNLTGRVVDAEGKGVPGATVLVYQSTIPGSDVEGSFMRGGAVSAADGTFAVKALTHHSHYAYIIAGKEGLAMSWREWATTSSESITVTLGKPFRLGGTVVDESGNPVPSAEVRAILDRVEAGRTFRIGAYGEDIDCLTRATDASGRFVFEAMPEGSRATFKVAAPGKVTTWTESPRFDEPQAYPFAAGDENIVVKLRDAVVVTGRVVEKGTGNPAAKVRLIVSGRGPNDISQIAVSAADGTFRADGIAPGRVNLSGSMQNDSGWLVERTSVILDKGATGDIVVEATRGALLEVSAVDADTGKPVRGIDACISEAGTDRLFALSAGADGVVRFRLRPGSYVLKYVQGSGSDYVGTGEIGLRYDLQEGDTQRAQVKIERKYRTVSGIVKDAGGNPVAGVSVLLCPQEPWTTPETVVTDENGRYETTLRTANLPIERGDAPYALARDLRNNAAATAEIAPKGQPTDVTLAPATSIVGRIAAADGAPAHNATVSLYAKYAPSGRYSIMRAIEADFAVTAGGRYEIKALPPSPAKYYVLKATAPGYSVQYVKIDYDAPRTDPIEIPAITLNPANHFVSGIVVDTNDKPVSGVEVTTDRYSAIENGEGQPYVTTKAGPDGRFRLEGIAAGKVRLRAFTGEVPASVTVEAGSTDAKLVLMSRAEQMARLRRPPPPLRSLIGKPLPDTEDIDIKPAINTVAGPLLVCFFDPDSRPSRELVKELSEGKEEFVRRRITVVLVDTGSVTVEKAAEWGAKNNVSCAIGVITKDHAQVLRAWGVPGVPRLILAGKDHIVRAEDVSLSAILAVPLGD